MKKEELKQVILQEAIYIKNLVSEKKQIEEALDKLNKEGKEMEDESLSKNISLTNKKSMPKRVDDPHRLKEDEGIDETTGKGLGIQHRASHKGEVGSHLKVENNIQESILRKFIKKQLFETYLKEEVKKYTAKVKHDNGTITMTVNASSEADAKKQIMNAEKCPESAISSIKEKTTK